MVEAAPAQVISELVHDTVSRRRAANFIGAVAAGAWHAERQDQLADEALALKPIESLHDAIQAAYEGDPHGRRMVEINAKADAIERTLKAGHVTKVQMEANEAGTIQQEGQTLESIQANTLRFAANNPSMRRRAEAETRNMFRLRHHYEQGDLENNYFVTLSRAADDMSEADMKKAGFFTDTMSMAIQVTSASGKTLTIESAFVAGSGLPGVARHDSRAVDTMLQWLGIDMAGLSATELLDMPLLVRKNMLPHGVTSLVEMYDDAAGKTFFGQHKPRRDYLAYREECVRREATFQPKIDQIVDDLIAEAPSINSRLMASERLNKISGRHMIDLAAHDASINPDVFGSESAARIEMARWHIEQGNFQMADIELTEAVKTDQSSSCPSGANGSGENSSKTSGDDGDCEFTSKECPECGKKNVRTVVKVIRLGGVKIGKRITGDCKCSITVPASH